MKIVEITWLDAAGTSEDVSVDSAARIQPIKRSNVGYLLRENENEVVISWGFLYDDDKIDRSDATKVLTRGMIQQIIVIWDGH